METLIIRFPENEYEIISEILEQFPGLAYEVSYEETGEGVIIPPPELAEHDFILIGLPIDTLTLDERARLYRISLLLDNAELAEELYAEYKFSEDKVTNGTDEGFAKLDLDSLIQIAKFLDYDDIIRFTSTNKNMKAVSERPEFWRDLVFHRFNPDHALNDRNYKELYLYFESVLGNYYPGSERYVQLEDILMNIRERKKFKYGRYFINLAIERELPTGSILKTAAYLGFIDIVELMLEKGVPELDVDAALHSSIVGGHLNIVKLLVAKLLDIYPTTLDVYAITAAYHGQLDIMKYFMSMGVDPHSTKLLFDAAHGSSIDMLEMLIENGALPLDNFELAFIKSKGYYDFFDLLSKHKYDHYTKSQIKLT